MKIRVNADRCQGHTVCNMTAPELFGLSDEDGHAFTLVETVPEHLEKAARRAVLGCPEQAIEIED